MVHLYLPRNMYLLVHFVHVASMIHPQSNLSLRRRVRLLGARCSTVDLYAFPSTLFKHFFPVAIFKFNQFEAKSLLLRDSAGINKLSAINIISAILQYTASLPTYFTVGADYSIVVSPSELPVIEIRMPKI